MSNELTISGLTVKTITEVTNDLVVALKAIYGADINVTQNTPDGQLIAIFAQAVIDNLELLSDVYNSFSVDLSYGTVLDQRVALNGLARRAGTNTQTNVLVTVSQALTLYGLDDFALNPALTVFTVKDDAGQEFKLTATHVFSGSGSATLTFQASTVGAIQTTPNTITNQVTTTLGVTSVNNPAATVVQGVDEESDSELKIRRAKSFFLQAQGPADAVEAALYAVDGVTDAFVQDNTTAGAVNGTAAHSVWCIVDGGTDVDVATAIYRKKAPGCGMRGAVVYTVSRPNGSTIAISFDRAVTEDLYIRFSLVAINGSDTFDTATLKEELVTALSFYKMNQKATIGDVVSAMLTLAPKGYLTSVGVSTDGLSYTDVVTPTSAKYKFVVATARITIS